jgi:hypothetical protein
MPQFLARGIDAGEHGKAHGVGTDLADLDDVILDVPQCLNGAPLLRGGLSKP